MLMALRRRGWVALVTVLVAAASAYGVATARGTTYTAESTAVVADHSREAVVTPDQANALAPTYATLLPNDAEFLQHMSRTLGTSVSVVQDRLAVFNPPGTALLVIDYTGGSAEDALAGAATALDAISGDSPVTPNITPSSIGAVQAATTASASRAVPVLVSIGVIVGIALGLLLIVVWERVDPRIDRPEDLSQEIGSPTSPDSEISPAGANALIARWKTLTEPGPSRIALVPVTPDVQADLHGVALTFGQARGKANGAGPSGSIGRQNHSVAGSGDLGGPIGGDFPIVIPFQVPTVDLSALRSIMDCDLVVLVARRGTPRAALRELLESLADFGVSPQWAIFLGSRASTARRPQRRPDPRPPTSTSPPTRRSPPTPPRKSEADISLPEA